MNAIRLHDIATVLEKYDKDFGFLDVFAEDVAEIAEAEPVFSAVGDDRFRARVDATLLELRMFRDKNVARFSLVRDSGSIGAGVLGGALLGAAAGGALGGLADAEDKRQAPAGVIFGLLLGGLLGGVAGAAATPRPPRLVLTLRYDRDTAQWRVYHGPYRDWAKEALRAE